MTITATSDYVSYIQSLKSNSDTFLLEAPQI